MAGDTIETSTLMDGQRSEVSLTPRCFLIVGATPAQHTAGTTDRPSRGRWLGLTGSAGVSWLDVRGPGTHDLRGSPLVSLGKGHR